jgi:ABC-2 type transport system ATP-binding protein
MPALYDMLTVWEHLEFIGRAYSLENWKDRAENLLERFELEDKKKKLGSELSKGMQQKVSICCGLLPNPKVILFDEPMVGLDPHAIKELKNLIVEKKKEGNAVLISTHMLDSVAEFWDSTNIMMDGRIAARRTRKEMEGSGEDLEALFFKITEGDKLYREGEK